MGKYVGKPLFAILERKFFDDDGIALRYYALALIAKAHRMYRGPGLGRKKHP